jgi:hypothetical protein
LAGGHLLYLAHFTFLGVGASLPEAMALYAFLIALLAWPLLRAAASERGYAITPALLLVAATSLSLHVRWDPMAPSIPPYSDKR